MKARVLYLMLSIVVIAQAFGQAAFHTPPIIDMHLHVYSVQSYWGGSDYVLKDTILLSPKTNIEHIEAVLEQIEKHNILLTYASGDFESLEMINNLYPGKFLPSYEVWPTKELLGDHEFISKLKMKIKNGEVQGIGEVANFYTGIAPNDPVMDTLYRIAQDNDLPIGLHFAPGPPGSQLTNYPNMKLEFSNPLLMQEVLIKFPQLRLSIHHAGLPIYQEETFGLMFMFPNVYVDISCLAWYCDYTRESLKDFLIKAVRYGFADRIMFGSDEMTWPGAIGLSIDYINNSEFLTEGQKQDILYNNAVRYLRLKNTDH